MNKNICDRIYDAHIHIPIKDIHPYKRFHDEVLQSGINGGMVIINSQEEANVFWENYDSIKNGDLGFLPAVAFILDVHSSTWKTQFDRLDNQNICYSVKVHPRISQITKKDFEIVAELISKVQAKSIIVDNWIFGPCLNNHIGTELTIFLAEVFRNKKIIMAHSGGVRLLETMLLTRPISNVFYDLSETCAYFKNTSVYLDIIHFIKFTNDRIMFGSDFPDFPIRHSIEMMEEELKMANLSCDEINNVMFRNAEKIYGGG